LTRRAIVQKIHRDLPATRVWGYGPPGSPSWPGPTIVADSNQTIYVNWVNNLRYANGAAQRSA
jgi:spore coat protein A